MKVVVTKGGLLLPDGAMDPQFYGRIISAGEDVPDTMSVGTFLVFHPHAGMDMAMNKRILKVLKYDELYGILEDDEIKEGLEAIVIGSPTNESKIISANSNLIV